MKHDPQECSHSKSLWLEPVERSRGWRVRRVCAHDKSVGIAVEVVQMQLMVRLPVLSPFFAGKVGSFASSEPHSLEKGRDSWHRNQRHGMKNKQEALESLTNSGVHRESWDWCQSRWSCVCGALRGRGAWRGSACAETELLNRFWSVLRHTSGCTACGDGPRTVNAARVFVDDFSTFSEWAEGEYSWWRR